ncbi:MAG: ATP-binding cassette domain-containing protein, partial [Bryobacteraceae bacterium]
TNQIIQHMVGREVSAIYHRDPLPPGEELLRVEGLTRRDKLNDIGFRLHAGEIVGLAGLVGAGRTEVCRALFGIDPIDWGRVYVTRGAATIRSPRDAVAERIALVTEDRQKTGLALGLAISRNMILANTRAISSYGFVSGDAEARVASGYVAKLWIKAPSVGQKAGFLSGGNQQKVVIGKWLFRDARIFLFDEPTRGIDVGAKAEVFELMDSLARQGAAILMVSSELPELLQVADRILVMRQGRITAELARPTTQEEIMRHAALAPETAP